LDKCLELFIAMEVLGPDDLWYCNRCKQHRQATKKFDLWSLPPVLVVHLKRFNYKSKYYREKLETLVSCPVKGLDLSNHLLGPYEADKPPVYDLYAVSNHYGSMGGGHYTAYALNKFTNKWYKFDDSYVTEIEENQVVTSSAYVLFYRRRDTVKPPAPLPDAETEPEPPTTTSSSYNTYNNNTTYHHHHVNSDDEEQATSTATISSMSHRHMTTITSYNEPTNHVSDHTVPNRFARFNSADTDEDDEDDDDDDSSEFEGMPSASGPHVSTASMSSTIGEPDKEYIHANSEAEVEVSDVVEVVVDSVVSGNGGNGSSVSHMEDA